jgi:hypothetical protein
MFIVRSEGKSQVNVSGLEVMEINYEVHLAIYGIIKEQLTMS